MTDAFYSGDGCSFTALQTYSVCIMAMRGDLEQLFREADVDGNNFLTLNELCSAMRRLGYTGDDAVIKVMFQYCICWIHSAVCHSLLIYIAI